MPTVYVVQEPRAIRGKVVDILGAMDFGSLETLLSKDVNVLDGTFVAREIFNKLRHITPEDYVLPIGDPAAIAIVCAIASKKTKGRFNILKWDRREMRYYPVTVNLPAAEMP